MNKILNNSPLVELVCDIRFNSSDPTIAGLLYSKIKDKYPNKNTARHFLNIDNNLQGTQQLVDLVQFTNESGKVIIQTGGNILTLNNVGDYKGWDDFLKTFKYVYNFYNEIVQNEKIIKLSLRSINKVHTLKNEFDINKQFLFKPIIPENITNPIYDFNMVIDEKGAEYKLSMKHYTIFPESEENISVLLDLEFETLNSIEPLKNDWETIENWLNSAHSSIYDAFKSSYTDFQFQKFQ